MNKNEILKTINELSNNAMFNVSLTSRELFHTNFWAWLLRKYPQIFTKVFYPKYNGVDNVEVLREKYNFDLLLKIDDEYIIVENKFKSMPYKEQLEKYFEKLNVDKKSIILISYFNPLFLSKLPNLEYISYIELYFRLKSAFTNAPTDIFEENDKELIQSYIDLINLLNQIQDSITWDEGSKIGDLLAVSEAEEIQEALSRINFGKTFERIFITKLTQEILKNFDYTNAIDKIRIDCGRDLKVFSDIMFYFPGAWDEDEKNRKDLCYLGISLWGNEYRYYAGLHKAQCGILAPKNGRADTENKTTGFKYLSENYGWFFNQENTCKWNGYSYEKEMYLYKKIDISNLTVKELAEKAIKDLSLIYFYLKPMRENLCQD